MKAVRAYLRELTSVAELRECEAVQLAVWGGATPEVTVASLRAAVHAGALVVGAFGGDTLLGFAYGFPSYVGGRVGMHSHLLAVLPEARGQGLGQALKWFQRAWCLDRGVPHMTWTFDPLQAKNARLNFEHLGAFVQHYHPDFYGTLEGALTGALPTDRVVAEWPLTSRRVVALAAGERGAAARQPAASLLIRTPDGEPELTQRPSGAGEPLWLELPPQIDPLGDAPRVLRWRLALREALTPLLEGGYRATRFVAGGYVLERSQP